MNRLVLTLAICGPLAAVSVSAQIPGGYEIVTVTNDQNHDRNPRINNRSQIVFGRGHGSSPENWEILLYDDGELTQITNDGVYDALPDINDRGTIVWTRAFGPPTQWGPNYEIVLYEDGVVTRLTYNDVEDHSPSINNHGQVVWSRDHLESACGGPLKDIFMWDQGQVIQVTTDAIPEQVENQSPEINDLGEIVWTRYDFCDPPPPFNFTSKIMMYSGGVITELTTGQIEPLVPDINDFSQVTWSAVDSRTGNLVIELWDAGVTTVLTEGGDGPAINDSTDVAFFRPDPGRNAMDIWLYQADRFYLLTEDPTQNLVPDINDAGEVAWSWGSYPTRNVRYLRRFQRGDLNCDGTLNGADIDVFFRALGDPIAYAVAFPQCDYMLADMNDDALVNGADIDPFFEALVP